MENKIKFIFDLDGTVTKEETLPLIAAHFAVQEKIAELTKETVSGNIPFIESFIKRVHILGRLPVNEINELLAEVRLYEQIVEFITANSKDCAIATGNLCEWISKLAARTPCEVFCSTGIIENNRVQKLTTILQKEKIVADYQKKGYKVVFIGDGNNDVEAMRLADVAIACGLTHAPTNSVLTVADYSIYDEQALVQQLEKLKNAA